VTVSTANGKVSPREAARLLAARDPVMARLVEGAGLPRFPRPTESHFAALIRSITHQQLAGAAAKAIHGRLVALLGDEVTPERILATSTEDLRAAGLSYNKILSVQDLASKVVDGTVVLNSRGLSRESDEEVVARLSTVRGIGKCIAPLWPGTAGGRRSSTPVRWRPRLLARLRVRRRRAREREGTEVLRHH
jgi:DNA-3-methyladenine glycosylase II